MKKGLLFLLLTIILTSYSYAQEKSDERKIRVGITGAGLLNMHSGEFSAYDGLLICGTFDGTNSIGWGLGNTIEIPFMDKYSFFGRVSYNSQGGNFESFPEDPVRISLDDGTLIPLSTEHQLDVSLNYLQVDLMGAYYFMDNIYVALGPGVSIPLTASYTQNEEILQPFGINFRNGSRSRQIASANFDDNPNTETNLVFTAHLLAGADFEISDNLYLSPEVGYIFPFSNVLSSNEWNVNTVHAGLALKLEIGGSERVIVKEAEPPPPPPAPEFTPTPVATLQARNIMDDGSMLAFGQISVEEEQKNNYVPLLPYIYFEAGSSTIPARYKKLSASNRGSFNENNLKDSLIGVYHNILNIIGSRMNDIPDATLEITGHVEPIDDGNNLNALSMNRAETVKQYLEDVWGISGSKLVVKADELPDQISNRNVIDGRNENRRVELKSSNPDILAPVRIIDSEFDVNPEAIALQPEVQYTEEVKSYSLSTSTMEGEQLWSTSESSIDGNGVRWDFNRDEIIPLAKKDIQGNYISANLEAEAGDKTAKAKTAIPLYYKQKATYYDGEVVKDSVIERYNLIFFDFDKPNINRANEYTFRQIRQRINTNSSVSITGFTDRTGDDAYNKRLSIDRANAVEEAIRDRVIPDNIYSKGVGETLIYNNDLPEGRFYNRTVLVEITTPIKSKR